MARRTIFLVALCTLVAIVVAEELYTDKYDYIDIDAVLSNPRIRNQYYNCYQDLGPCLTPDAKFFKEKFPEAIVTKCRKCTAKQKEIFEKIVLFYTEKEPEKWNKVLLKAIQESKKSSDKKNE
ncbi:PREDICTED: ejaculatory bulb-specific protein 3-like [Ceratosolen solmsi marchali]|uniref:Ejaculatory bulb-specific protein 3-like n=1 Tax=Ceratosolen solmsi marchali TaxID=326594 RepID=A0AAJ6YQY3_9HYME|nr:PREDICTED: ejaculatory bulb-specific protein 3-like [Ceratosolen solmsi marchali]